MRYFWASLTLRDGISKGVEKCFRRLGSGGTLLLGDTGGVLDEVRARCTRSVLEQLRGPF